MKKVLSIIMIMLLCASMLLFTACSKDDAADGAGDVSADAGTADTGNDTADAGETDADTGDTTDDAEADADAGEEDTVKESDSVDVFVTIASEGKLAVYENITASDFDGDGVVTLSDALACAHDEKYDGGAAAGYLAEDTEYGISISKLWGVENGGSYGFYLNNTFVDTLLAPLNTGDIVSAYSFADLAGWSDVYSYFDQAKVSSTGEVKLTLTYIGFDENFAPVPTPAANVTITVNGEATSSVTDENGAVTLNLEDGEYIISATTDAMTLVPPVCIATVGK